jgi:hypothetical protein
MIKEKVIIQKVPIATVGQVQYFQVKIPRDAKRIIGIETTSSNVLPIMGIGGIGGIGGGGGGFGIPHINLFGLIFTPSPYLGELRLLSCGKTNLFYAADIYQQDANIAEGDYSATTYFTPNDWSHGIKHEEDEVNEDGDATLLKGIFKDKQDPSGLTYTYTVGVYVWYEKISKEV